MRRSCAKYLIHDADPLFTDGFKAILKPPDFRDGEGVVCVKIPPRSPNCNPHAERFVKSIKYEQKTTSVLVARATTPLSSSLVVP